METHGYLRGVLHDEQRRPAEYIAWRNMRRRCTNPRAKNYANYGGRGIRVCDRWLHSFVAFLTDVGPRSSEKYPTGHTRFTLERINNDGHYEPGNVRWATYSEQLRNKRPQQSERLVAPHWIRRNTRTEGEYYVLVIPRRLPPEWRMSEGG